MSAAATALKDPAATPSARVLRELEACENSYLRFALSQSVRHKRYLRDLPWDHALDERYGGLARDSLRAQRDTESADRVSFETYRQQYLALNLLD